MWIKQAGATAIEFALVLPLYLLVIDGVLELSMLMYDQCIVLNAAREAARTGVVLSDPKMSATDIAAVANTYAQQYLLSFGATDAVNISVTPSADGSFQTPLNVTVSYTYTSLLAGNLLSALHSPVLLTSSVTLLNE